jgi:hypothetical protein
MTRSDACSATTATGVALARRTSSGLTVTLLWAEDTNAVTVLVRDGRTHDQFELAVDAGASPLDVFEHPYAYAAWRGVDYQGADLRRAA